MLISEAERSGEKRREAERSGEKRREAERSGEKNPFPFSRIMYFSKTSIVKRPTMKKHNRNNSTTLPFYFLYLREK